MIVQQNGILWAVLWLVSCSAGVSTAGIAGADDGSSEKLGTAKTADTVTYRATAEYDSRTMHGWQLMVAPDLLTDTRLADRVFAELERQLVAISQVVPPEPLAKLRKITIWVEKEEGHHPCMAYHPDRRWLIEHDMNPDKARCVEIANARNFIGWTKDQPWMVLHELAHGYHDQFLPGGYGNRELRERFERAKAQGKYEKVAYVRGGEKRAYALNNPMEFFAENSEALFGRNDFFPFNRADLESFDPETFALLCKLWELPADKPCADENAVSR